MDWAGYFSQGLRHISVSPAVLATQQYIHNIPLAVSPELKQPRREADKLGTCVVIKTACSDTSTPQDAWIALCLIAYRYFVISIPYGVRMPVVTEFFAIVLTGPWAQPASVKWVPVLGPRGRADGAWPWPFTPPPISCEVKERVQLYLYSYFGISCSVLGWTLSLPLLRQLRRSSISLLLSAREYHQLIQSTNTRSNISAFV